MIQLECSNCKAVLAIDDAFAGGVCRCQHCGTIQTVPKPGRENALASDADSPKALFKRKARIESALSPYNDGLDRIADEMDSSGALSANAIPSAPSRRSSSPATEDVGVSSRSGVSGQRQGRAGGAVAVASPPPAQTGFAAKPSQSATVVTSPAVGKKRTAMLATVIGISAGVVLIGAITAYAISGDAKPSVSDSGAILGASEQVQPAGADGVICGIPLRGSTVVYVIDRSGVTQQAFQDMANLCFKSAESLGSGRQFQIVVWNNYQDLAYPVRKSTEASAAEIENARKAIADTYAGSTDLAALLRRAADANATDIVILSAVDADERTAGDIRETVKDKGIRVHAIAIGSDLQGDQLRQVSSALGGQFRQLPLESIN